MKTNYQNAGLLDMIFENRNKSYGAYAIRSGYNTRMFLAIAFSVGSILTIILGKVAVEKFLSTSKPGMTYTNGGHFLTDLKIPILNTKEVEKQKQAEKPKPVNKPTQKSTEMKVVQSPVDSVPENDALLDLEPGLTTNLEGNPLGVEGGAGDELIYNVDPEPSSIPTEPIRIAEVMPVFPGGEKALLEFLAKNTEYPRMELEMGIEGKVISEFTIDESGKVSDIKILRSPSRGFDREVIRVVKIMPDFTPGMQQGRPVKVRYVLPFTFTNRDFGRG